MGVKSGQILVEPLAQLPGVLIHLSLVYSPLLFTEVTVLTLSLR
jgi:hypothetical protein